MLSEETTSYYYSTTAHISGGNDDLHAVFHRFNMTYLIFHRLYDVVPDALEKKTGTTIEKGLRKQDNARAIQFPIQLLGVKNVMQGIINENLLPDIELLADVIEKEVFHIKFSKDNVHDRVTDIQSSEGLKSKDDQQIVDALFNIIYQVRNNIQHARKHTHAYQRILLEPLTRILTVINEMLFTELNKQD